MTYAEKMLLILLVIVVGLLAYVRITDRGESKQAQAGSAIESGEETTVLTDHLAIDFLDIGQGDATFITFPNGEQMLIDCGKDGRVLSALGRVMPFYDHSIDYLVVTHPDLDHYGGCTDVVDRFDVKHVVWSGLSKPGEAPWEYFEQAFQKEVSAERETIIDTFTEWDIASAIISFLYPTHAITENASVPGVDKKTNDNDASIIIKLSFGNQDVLLTGDAEAALEMFLVDTYGEELDVELLKVGHHGSGSSSLEEFLHVVTPDIAVISVGAENTYGHPTPRVLKRLERIGARVHRTDLEGGIRFWVSKREIKKLNSES